MKKFVQENVAIYNGTKGDPKSFDLLDQLLSHQVYRLAYWRVASEEINYRRFFDVNELAAVRMEDPAVFLSSHQLILQLLKHGAVSGLRIDHVDGVYGPSTYLGHFQQWATANRAPRAEEAAVWLFLAPGLACPCRAERGGARGRPSPGLESPPQTALAGRRRAVQAWL